MDQIDFDILEILQEKARIPNVEVARKIGMAPSAALERIKKLEAKGIIAGYEMRVNPEHFNRSLIAFIQIETKTKNIRKTAIQIASFEEVQEVHCITGQDRLLIKVRLKNTDDLESLLHEKLAPISTITATHSTVVLSTYKESAQFPLKMNST